MQRLFSEPNESTMNLINRITEPQPSLAEQSAMVGGIIWIVLLFLPIADVTGVSYIERYFLLAPLVIVPLGLSLIEPQELHGLHTWPYRMALLAQPVGALFCVAAFFFPQGIIAAALASVWLFVTALIAFSGVSRFLLRGAMRVEEVCLSFALMFIVIGGVWFVMSRLGFHPLGFGDTIVLLTAVHFHYTGFGATLLAALTGRTLRTNKDGRMSPSFYVVVICLIAGTPIVAAGITFSSGLIGLVGALIVSCGLWLLAGIVMARIVGAVKNWTARILFFISCTASSLSMVLACLYAYSLVSKKLMITIPRMAELHGTANAIGFVLCGLFAWALVHKKK
jgi:hypothetical protein